MPWTDKPGGNGSKGSGNGSKGPWGQGSQGGGNNGGNTPPPDLEELLKSGRDRFRRTMGGRGGNNGGGGGNVDFNRLPKGPIAIGATVILAFFGWQLFTYQVETNEQAVVTTFGKFSKIETSGLRFRIPVVQEVTKVAVTEDRSVDIGKNARNLNESSMLTSDLNIANVSFSVNWRIKTTNEEGQMPPAAQFVFNVEEPRNLVKSVAEAAIREVVGASEFDPLITNGRSIVPSEVERIMQEALDSYESGILIQSVNFDKAEPPQAVIQNQLDVINARSEKAQKINVAEAYANREVPRARGAAEEKLLDAEAYAVQTVAEARGAASRFNDIYAEYARAPEVTRQRMYLETVEQVLGDMNKIVIDNDAGGAVPYLSLNELTRQRGTTAN